jgi:hypothetical protein
LAVHPIFEGFFSYGSEARPRTGSPSVETCLLSTKGYSQETPYLRIRVFM